MPTYNFDQHGNLAENLIPNEVHSVTEINGITAFKIVPMKSPFYAKGFTMFNESGTELHEGEGFIFTDYHDQISEHTGLDTYKTVILTDKAYSGNITINYQTVGGAIVDDRDQTIVSALSTIVDGKIEVEWPDEPIKLPTTAHTHSVGGLSGIAWILENLDKIVTAIENLYSGITIDDIADLGSGFVDPLLQSLSDINTTLTIQNQVGSSLEHIMTRLDALGSSSGEGGATLNDEYTGDVNVMTMDVANNPTLKGFWARRLYDMDNITRMGTTRIPGQFRDVNMNSKLNIPSPMVHFVGTTNVYLNLSAPGRNRNVSALCVLRSGDILIAHMDQTSRSSANDGNSSFYITRHKIISIQADGEMISTDSRPVDYSNGDTFIINSNVEGYYVLPYEFYRDPDGEVVSMRMLNNRVTGIVETENGQICFSQYCRMYAKDDRDRSFDRANWESDNSKTAAQRRETFFAWAEAQDDYNDVMLYDLETRWLKAAGYPGTDGDTGSEQSSDRSTNRELKVLGILGPEQPVNGIGFGHFDNDDSLPVCPKVINGIPLPVGNSLPSNFYFKLDGDNNFSSINPLSPLDTYAGLTTRDNNLFWSSGSQSVLNIFTTNLDKISNAPGNLIYAGGHIPVHIPIIAYVGGENNLMNEATDGYLFHPESTDSRMFIDDLIALPSMGQARLNASHIGTDQTITPTNEGGLRDAGFNPFQMEMQEHFLTVNDQYTTLEAARSALGYTSISEMMNAYNYDWVDLADSTTDPKQTLDVQSNWFLAAVSHIDQSAIDNYLNEEGPYGISPSIHYNTHEPTKQSLLVISPWGQVVAACAMPHIPINHVDGNVSSWREMIEEAEYYNTTADNRLTSKAPRTINMIPGTTTIMGANFFNDNYNLYGHHGITMFKVVGSVIEANGLGDMVSEGDVVEVNTPDGFRQQFTVSMVYSEDRVGFIEPWLLKGDALANPHINQTADVVKTGVTVKRIPHKVEAIVKDAERNKLTWKDATVTPNCLAIFGPNSLSA